MKMVDFSFSMFIKVLEEDFMVGYECSRRGNMKLLKKEAKKVV